MRFMIIVKAAKDSEAGVMPEEKLIATMATYHEELAKAGGKRTVIDGPFTETKEQTITIAGKCPAAEWATVEVREVGPCHNG